MTFSDPIKVSQVIRRLPVGVNPLHFETAPVTLRMYSFPLGLYSLPPIPRILRLRLCDVMLGEPIQHALEHVLHVG